jgi:hypothetical protein
MSPDARIVGTAPYAVNHLLDQPHSAHAQSLLGRRCVPRLGHTPETALHRLAEELRELRGPTTGLGRPQG